MTDGDAHAWMDAHVPRETIGKLSQFVDLLLEANATQNLISSTTIGSLWARHIVDSAQLLDLVPPSVAWTDIGSGAGFPGMVVAITDPRPVTLIDSRRLRTMFLADAAGRLGLDHVTVQTARVETIVAPPAGVLSARAVMPLPKLIAAMHHLANEATVWVLPKGRNAASELAAARETWQGSFVMHPSITDPEAAIIVARHVAPREGRR